MALPRYATGTVLTNSTPQHVAIVDGNGTQITSFDHTLTSADVVTVTGGAAQTADVKITLDGETVTAGHNITGIAHGVKTVTTVGTDEALAGSTACKKVDIQAQTDNTGVIAVGATGVDATVATGTGILLNAGDVYSLEIDNLADIFIDATVNGEGVRYVYYT